MNPDTLSARILAVGDTHQVDLPLRWGDSDALNHLNNTLYFRLMEEARMRILYDAGFELPANDGAILAHASCDFLRPLTYPATVRVTHTVTRIGRSSAEFELLLEKVGDDAGPYARAAMCWSGWITWPIRPPRGRLKCWPRWPRSSSRRPEARLRAFTGQAGRIWRRITIAIKGAPSPGAAFRQAVAPEPGRWPRSRKDRARPGPTCRRQAPDRAGRYFG